MNYNTTNNIASIKGHLKNEIKDFIESLESDALENMPENHKKLFEYILESYLMIAYYEGMTDIIDRFAGKEASKE